MPTCFYVDAEFFVSKFYQSIANIFLADIYLSIPDKTPFLVPGATYTPGIFFYFFESRIGGLVKEIIGLYYYYRIYNSISTKNCFNIILESPFLDTKKN